MHTYFQFRVFGNVSRFWFLFHTGQIFHSVLPWIVACVHIVEILHLLFFLQKSKPHSVHVWRHWEKNEECKRREKCLLGCLLEAKLRNSAIKRQNRNVRPHKESTLLPTIMISLSSHMAKPSVVVQYQLISYISS